MCQSVPPVLSPDITEMSLAVFFALSLQILIYNDEILPEFLFSRLNSPSPLNLSSYEGCSSPLIILQAPVSLG